jgi:two-component system, cell cycle response regulator DivK
MTAETILIVEDNPVNRKLLVMLLRAHGYQLLTANDGEEAIVTAKQALPDLILMDLQLPKMNGYMAAQRLKEQRTTSRIPIVAMTAHALIEAQDYSNQFGFSGIITKPIDTRAFPAQVRTFLTSGGSSENRAKNE